MSSTVGAPPSVSDRLIGALGGTELMAEAEAYSSGSEDPDDVVEASQSTVDGNPFESEHGADKSNSSEPTDPALAGADPSKKATKGTLDKEVIVVTDEQGRRRKVEIDYSNREAVKKAFSQAAGMRKFQAERDQIIQKSKAQEAETAELRNNWASLENAYKGGIEGLVDLLEGRQGSFKELVRKEVEKARFLEDASPAEIRAHQEREAQETLQKNYEKLRKDNEKFKEEITAREQNAELKSLEATVHPTFFKYSYENKLGSPEDEQMFNEMLWGTAMNRLKPYEEQGLALTPELVDRTFRDVAGRLNKRIGAQADKRVSKVIDQKKQEAAENVQSKVKSGYTNSSEADRLKQHIASGDTGAIFKNWSSFNKLLGGRK